MSNKKSMIESTSQTRRGFVKTAGIALAGAAAMGLAGCAPSGGATTTTNAADNGTWDEEFDVIVVGGGGSDNELRFGSDVRRVVTYEYFNSLCSEV